METGLNRSKDTSSKTDALNCKKHSCKFVVKSSHNCCIERRVRTLVAENCRAVNMRCSKEVWSEESSFITIFVTDCAMESKEGPLSFDVLGSDPKSWSNWSAGEASSFPFEN